MNKILICLLLLACVACEPDTIDDPQTPKPKTLIENGPDIPAHISPESLSLLYVIIEHQLTKRNDTIRYIYNPDYTVREVRDTGVTYVCKYENGRMTELAFLRPQNRSVMQLQKFTYKDGRLHEILWHANSGTELRFRDSIRYDAANRILGTQEYLYDPQEQIVNQPYNRRTFTWQGENVVSEQFEPYDVQTQQFQPAITGAQYTYNGRKNLVDRALPDFYRWKHTYDARYLSDACVSSVKFDPAPNLPVQAKASIYRYTFQEDSLRLRQYRYSKDSILTHITSIYFSPKS